MVTDLEYKNPLSLANSRIPTQIWGEQRIFFAALSHGMVFGKYCSLSGLKDALPDQEEA